MRPRRCDLAMVLLTTLILTAATTPARAGEGDEAAETIGGDTPRSTALGIYHERCGVEPGSARERYAQSDWEQLVAAGSDPARLLEVAEAIPLDCSYISFKGAILATEREILKPPPPAEPARVDAAPVTRPWKTRSPRKEALRWYGTLCGPLTEDGSRKAEADYQELLDLRFPSFDDDDIRDNARRFHASCATESFRAGILRVELDRLRLRRNIGFIGGGLLLGVSVIPVVYSSLATPCEGGLECLGPDLDRFGGLMLGIAGIITGTILVLVGAAEQHNVERIRRLLGEAPRPDLPGQVRWTGNGVSLRF